MPRPGPRRPPITLRLSEGGIAHVDARAIEEGLLRGNGDPNRSDMVRIMLAYASIHMPKGWRPPSEKPPAGVVPAEAVEVKKAVTRLTKPARKAAAKKSA